MGDLEFGFEEMQGVKLGYLIIQGKQMFALSQVFTDLLKNIPRTTVHKRMDHLNVKKHHCDLEELRQLKAINSVAFHAAKCTLISREDVEALYFSCKTQRVLKSNKRKTKTKTDRDIRGDTGATGTAANGFWKEKLWLSLRTVPPTLGLRNKAVRPEGSPNLPQVYSKSIYQNFQSIPQTSSRAFRNYETVQIPGKGVEFGEKLSFFRSAEILKRKPVVSAISTQSDSERLYKKKRRTDRPFGSRKRHYRQLLFVPSCCKPKPCVSNRSLRHFHPNAEVFLESHYQESCSSDSECSSGNDSDFGSSLSTSSSTSSSTNSRTSDDEDSLSCSSEESSDAESSSHSDSSSVSSRVSVQSIRFRRPGFSNINSKTPLVLQPTFHYKSNFQHKNGSLQEISPGFGGDKEKQVQSLETASWKNRHKMGEILDFKGKLCSAENKFLDLKKILPKTNEFGKNKDFSPAPCANGKVFHQQRHSVHHAQLAQYEQDKDTVISKAIGSIFSEDTNPKKDTKQDSFKQSLHFNPVKTETEDVWTDSDATRRTPLNHVKIKVEDTLDEYEYGTQDSHLCEGKPDTVTLNYTGKLASPEITLDLCKDGIKTTSHPPQQEPVDTLKNCERVRKSHRASVWAKKVVENVPKTNTSASKLDRSPRSSGKSAIKRPTNPTPSLSKPTFSFMANFPCPPSLVISSDGDLSPAYSLNSLRTNQVPHPSHPVWRWQLGASVVPPHLNHRFRKETH